MVSVRWFDEEKTILKWTIEGQWTAAELVEGFETYRNLLTETERGPYHIIDLTGAVGMPSNLFSQFPNMARNLPGKSEKRAKALIVVGSKSDFLKRLASIFSSVYGGEFTFFDRMAEAIAHIEALQQTEGT